MRGYLPRPLARADQGGGGGRSEGRGRGWRPLLFGGRGRSPGRAEDGGGGVVLGREWFPLATVDRYRFGLLLIHNFVAGRICRDDEWPRHCRVVVVVVHLHLFFVVLFGIVVVVLKRIVTVPI